MGCRWSLLSRHLLVTRVNPHLDTNKFDTPRIIWVILAPRIKIFVWIRRCSAILGVDFYDRWSSKVSEPTRETNEDTTALCSTFFSSLKEFTKGRRYFVTVIKVGTKSVSSVRRAYTKPSVDIFDRGKSSASSWEFIL